MNTIHEQNFLEHGFCIIEVENITKLTELREKIFQKAREVIGYQGHNVEELFNNFHNYHLEGAELNEKRMAIINYCTQHLEIGKTIYELFPQTITDFIGPDIVAQKTTNLVIQQPHDPNAEALHRDSPANSPFEITVWLPLVDVYKTKSMYLLSLPHSKKAIELLGENYDAFVAFAKQHRQSIEIPFGKALFFWQGLIHGVPVNTENETRWSLNIRYKNIFSPCGTKGLIEFFDMLRLSPLTKIAFEYEKEVYTPEANTRDVPS